MKANNKKLLLLFTLILLFFYQNCGSEFNAILTEETLEFEENEFSQPSVSQPIETPDLDPSNPADLSDPANSNPIDNPSASEIVFYHDFNDELLHTYTVEDIYSTWDAQDAITVRPNAVNIVNDPDMSGAHGHVMQVFYAAGEFKYHGNSGFQWVKKLKGYNELYFSYDVFFETDAEFVKTGKLPGLRSTDWLATHKGKIGVTKPDGTDFWSGGLSWGVDGELKAYVYHANQFRLYGDPIHWDDGADKEKTYFTPGKWHRIEVRLKMNTPGELDGKMQGWFDGELRLDINRIMFRMPGGEELRIGQYLIYSFYGGNDSTFAPSEDQHVYFDNFVLSKRPITH